MSDFDNAAYQAGAAAYADGKTLEDCPHEVGSPDGEMWTKGFKEARREENQDESA